MVETAGPDGRHVAQATEHLVSDGEGNQKIAPTNTGVLGRRQDRPEVIAGMGGLALGEVAVVEVEIAYQSAVVEGGSVRGVSAAGDQGTPAVPVKFCDLIVDQADWLAAQCADGTTQRVEDADLELMARRFREILVARSHDERRELLTHRDNNRPPAILPLGRNCDGGCDRAKGIARWLRLTWIIADTPVHVLNHSLSPAEIIAPAQGEREPRGS